MRSDISLVNPLEYNLATRNAIGDILTRVATLLPNRTAIIDRDTEHTFGQLNKDAEAIATALTRMSLSHDTPVAVLMANSYDYFANYFGVLKAGLTIMPINYTLSADDVQWILNDSKAETVITDDTFVSLISDSTEQPKPPLTSVIVRTTVSKELGATFDGAKTYQFATLKNTTVDQPVETVIESDSVAQCLYTSGTTSRPKGALMTHNSVVTATYANATLIGASWDRGPSKLLSLLPLYHVTALNTLAIPMLSHGGTVVLPGPFDPVVCLQQLEKYQIDRLMALPLMYGAMLAANDKVQANLSHVRKAIFAMAQMSDSIMAGLRTMMPNAEIILGSGQTEVLPATVMQWNCQNPEKIGSWGMPAPSVQIAIMDPMGQLLAPGEIGEIVYRGPHVTTGYWNNPQANATSFAHGWFHSGDIGYQDDDGTVWFTDRAKDIIKTGGENVSSLKVEQVLMDAPGVIEVTVVATPHEHWGEAVTAVVLSDQVESPEDPRAAQLEQAIIAYARERLAGFEAPKSVRFVNSLPRTSTGKIRKNVIRAMLS